MPDHRAEHGFRTRRPPPAAPPTRVARASAIGHHALPAGAHRSQSCPTPQTERSHAMDFSRVAKGRPSCVHIGAGAACLRANPGPRGRGWQLGPAAPLVSEQNHRATLPQGCQGVADDQASQAVASAPDALRHRRTPPCFGSVIARQVLGRMAECAKELPHSGLGTAVAR